VLRRRRREHWLFRYQRQLEEHQMAMEKVQAAQIDALRKGGV
jgi:hypothetical protein